MWSPGPQSEVVDFLFSLKVCSALSGHDRDKFQAGGLAFAQRAHPGCGCACQLRPKVKS